LLGSLPNEAQPSQKTFESRLWQSLRKFDPAKVVFVESESKKVGNLRVPESLMEKIRSSVCLSLSLSAPNRVQLLMQDYAHFLSNPDLLNKQLACLVSLHGHQKIAHWQALATSNQMTTLVEELLISHYDPAYLRSIERNFAQISNAINLELPDISEQSFLNLARRLHAGT
jgi:tRNA 2-selenouridine synthase